MIRTGCVTTHAPRPRGSRNAQGARRLFIAIGASSLRGAAGISTQEGPHA